jgi:HSP20 family protein
MIVPGVKSDDVNLQFQDGRLIIDVTIPAPKLENVIWHCRELGHGQYHREISLPFAINTDKVEATLANGYLTLRLPKADEVKPKKIQIKAH